MLTNASAFYYPVAVYEYLIVIGFKIKRCYPLDSTFFRARDGDRTRERKMVIFASARSKSAHGDSLTACPWEPVAVEWYAYSEVTVQYYP